MRNSIFPPNGKTSSPAFKRKGVQVALVFFTLFILADYIYKTSRNITYLNRQECIIFRSMPKLMFLFFEYYIELTMFVFVGVFLATLSEKYFSRVKNVLPSNPVSAFFYASILPICACAAIPFVKTMREKMPMRNVITFVVAAPILNPYIIFISFSALGTRYGVLRILSALVLAVSSGYVIELFNRGKKVSPPALPVSQANRIVDGEYDMYCRTLDIFVSIIPYLLLSGAFAIALEYYYPGIAPLQGMYKKTITGDLLVIILAIPLYLCNGTDVLLLRPFLNHGAPYGTGIAFSLASTAICITSFFMLFKFLGKRLTLLLTLHIMIMCLLLSQVINRLL